MSNIASLQNRQVRLAKRPTGLPTRDVWSFTDEPVPEPGDGAIVVKNLAISLDPAMRGWMNEGKSYIEPVNVGDVMRAGENEEVTASKSHAFKVGDMISAATGVQQYAVIEAAEKRKSGLPKIDLRAGTVTQW